MPSPMIKRSKSNQKNNCKQNSPRFDVSWRHPLFRASHGLMLVGGGEYKLYHSSWGPPIMCVAWKISRSLGCYVDNESIPLNYLSLFQNRALAPLQIPASLCEWPIYLLLCWVITFLLKSTRWRAHCHLHSLLLVYIGYDLTGSLLPWITMFSQSLIFKGDLHLCFAVSKRDSEIPFCYIMLWLFWLASWLCYWYE